MRGDETVRVFNINKAIGVASSGVEYAQSYRRELFAGIDGVDDRYVFTDYMGTNIHFFSAPMGLADARVLWIYHLLTGRETVPSSFTLEAFLDTIAQPHADPAPGPDYTDIVLTDSRVRYRVRTLPGPLVDRVETLVGEQVVRIAHYDATLHNVEHFHENRLIRRDFYTADGRLAAEQFYRDREITRTLIMPASPLYEVVTPSFRGNVLIEGRSRFFQHVFRHLLSRPDDVVIVDRALDVIDGLYPVLGDHRLYSVVHAEHYDLTQIEDDVLLWNNHYENVFMRPDLVDAFIVSTHRQRMVLKAQLAAKSPPGTIPAVVCIPAGFVSERGRPAAYTPFTLVTASRLAEEKHLDLLIRAVAEIRKTVPEVRLDIYGEGNREPLLALIAETHTEECVRLRGHRRLEGVLGRYALYVSASTSEGFGLSLLEAIAEGLPIVGFDVDYGNREMVESGVNGRLVPHTSADRDVVAITEAVLDVLTSGRLDVMRAQSRAIAEAYTAAHVRMRWERLLLGGEAA